jgi:hypothetical protein
LRPRPPARPAPNTAPAVRRVGTKLGLDVQAAEVREVQAADPAQAERWRAAQAELAALIREENLAFPEPEAPAPCTGTGVRDKPAAASP